MKKLISLIVFAAIAICVSAQESKPWFSNIRLSGYGMTQYQYSNQEGGNSQSFNLRLFRLSLDGRLFTDFYWKTQLQLNGNTSTLGSSPRLVDLYIEWQKYSMFRIKVGQFKIPFTFENPMSPIDQGFMNFGQNINNLSGFTDRVGEHASNGRDIGVQLQGDVLRTKSGRFLLHYQIGVFNGQGINVKDVDQQKDLIAGLWVYPIEGLRLGIFGWEGSYARKGKWKDERSGSEHEGVRKLKKHRYALSAEYCTNDWTFRTEYIHSTGQGFKNTYQQSSDAKDLTISSNGDKAEGVYALIIAPLIEKKLYAKARYDYYTPTGSGNKSKVLYEAGFNYMFNSKVQLNTEFAHVVDKTISKQNYNIIDFELDFKF